MNRYSITFSLEQLQYIVSMLEQKPYNEVAYLIALIKEQYDMANKPVVKC